MRAHRYLAAFAGVFILTLSFALHQGVTAQQSAVSSTTGAKPPAQASVISASYPSMYMGFAVRYLVYLPQGYEPDGAYPVWYGLHGNSTSETMWLQNTSVAKTAETLTAQGKLEPMIMVFPFVRYDSAKTIQADMQDGVRSESLSELFMCRELIPAIDGAYATNRSAAGRYIGGFSMGGYFALQAALHHPNLFSKVGAYSPALAYSDFTQGNFDVWLNYGNPTPAAQESVTYAKEHHLDALKVYLDCGSVGDPFAQGVQSLGDTLLARGIDTQLHIHSGGHTLQDANIGAYLLFYAGKP